MGLETPVFSEAFDFKLSVSLQQKVTRHTFPLVVSGGVGIGKVPTDSDSTERRCMTQRAAGPGATTP